MKEVLEKYVLWFFKEFTQEFCLSSVDQERKIYLGQIPALDFLIKEQIGRKLLGFPGCVMLSTRKREDWWCTYMLNLDLVFSAPVAQLDRATDF